MACPQRATLQPRRIRWSIDRNLPLERNDRAKLKSFSSSGEPGATCAAQRPAWQPLVAGGIPDFSSDGAIQPMRANRA